MANPQGPSITRADEPIYVNYLPMHRAIRRASTVFAIVAMSALLAFAAAWSASRANPGPAIWDDGVARTFTGALITAPYPMLITTDEATGRPRAMLLVEVGKRGTQERFAALPSPAPAQTTLSGWVLSRDGRTMLELEPEQAQRTSTIAPAPIDGESVHHQIPDSASVRLRGQIVDAKCYLGAMKPGDGKSHKACATLCIRGGIPPVLICQTPGQPATSYVLQGPDGSLLPASVLHLIADPVEVTGEVSVIADIKFLTIKPDGVRRL